MKRVQFAVLTACALLGGCSPAPAPVSHSTNDPSSPSGQVGVNPLVAISTGASPPASSAAPSAPHDTHHAHQHNTDGSGAHAGPSTADAASGTAVYVCPMHPEVTSTKAGEVCPKCNMKLVPKK